jgi:hypothetical protein
LRRFSQRKNTVKKQKYLSFLVRLWPVAHEGDTFWRASLETTQTGDRVGFSSLEALFAYIEQAACDFPGTLEVSSVDDSIPTERNAE